MEVERKLEKIAMTLKMALDRNDWLKKIDKKKLIVQ